VKRFDVEFVFYLEEGDDEASVRELIQWLVRNYHALDYDKAEAVQGIFIEYLFEVWVDRECWYDITRTSRDAFVATLRLPQAQITDEFLEDLADVEEMVPAAIWVLHNNEYDLTLETIQHYDDNLKASTDVSTI
jgi:hypothetical protein